MPVLFVCNGNVWRSQIAEFYFNNLFKERAISAGLSKQWDGMLVKDVLGALNLAPLLQWLQDNKIDIQNNKCKQVRNEHVEAASVIFVFDSGLLDEMQKMFPTAAYKTFLLGNLIGLSDPEIVNSLNKELKVHIATADRVKLAVEVLKQKGLFI